MLDIAIFISLNILELTLYERHIDGKDMPIVKGEADQVSKGIWDKFMTNNTAKKYLKKINELEALQKSHEDYNYILT